MSHGCYLGMFRGNGEIESKEAVGGCEIGEIRERMHRQRKNNNIAWHVKICKIASQQNAHRNVQLLPAEI